MQTCWNLYRGVTLILPGEKLNNLIVQDNPFTDKLIVYLGTSLIVTANLHYIMVH